MRGSGSRGRWLAGEGVSSSWRGEAEGGPRSEEREKDEAEAAAGKGSRSGWRGGGGGAGEGGGGGGELRLKLRGEEWRRGREEWRRGREEWRRGREGRDDRGPLRERLQGRAGVDCGRGWAGLRRGGQLYGLRLHEVVVVAAPCRPHGMPHGTCVALHALLVPTGAAPIARHAAKRDGCARAGWALC